MSLLDRVKFDGMPNNAEWLVCKQPTEGLSTATKLIVGEGQVAVFVKGGQIFDIFEAGTYTLSTDNIPILSSFINLPYGGKTPFTAEIYYINITSKLDAYWGTKDPIQMIDPKYNVRVRVRAFGQFGFKVSDYSIFLRELIGTLGPYKVCNPKNIINYFSGYLITKLKTIIASEITQEKISVLEITANLDELSDKAFAKIQDEFYKYGIEIVNFFIESINFPEEDFDMINKILLNKAEFDIIGEQRYNTLRSYDIYEKAAENEGGAVGAAATIGIGLGLAKNISNGMGEKNIEAIGENSQDRVKIYRCSCGVENDSSSNFCKSCGKKIIHEKICKVCNHPNTIDAKFCVKCGTLLVEKKVCSKCGEDIEEGTKFCSNCGERIGE